jgi:hypothetical protein
MIAEEHSFMCQQGIIWCIVAGITGATPEKVMEAWLDERENKEGVSEATEGSVQEEVITDVYDDIRLLINGIFSCPTQVISPVIGLDLRVRYDHMFHF